MKNIKDILAEIREAKTVLICGGENSGKTSAIKEIVRDLSLESTILVLSNHRDIKSGAFCSNNVDSLYKPKGCTNVDLKYLDTDDEYIFIDERCDNIEEIKENIDKKLIFVATIKDKESIPTYVKTYDLVIEVSKDEDGNALFLNSYKR